MRPRKDIEQDRKGYDALTLEVLLDIRDTLAGDVLYRCEVCGKECRSLPGLKSHMKQHPRK